MSVSDLFLADCPARTTLDLVAHRSLATAPRGVEYHLTELGETLLDPVRTLAAWAEAHTGALLAARERHARSAQQQARSRAVSSLRTLPHATLDLHRG